MSMINALTAGATIASGVVSGMVVLSALLDVVTKGWVRDRFQKWAGITEIREQNATTETFLADLGESHNELSQTVCDQHKIDDEDRPDEVRVDQFERYVNNEGPDRGDFLRGGNDD
jgi:hypothetical protein